MVSIPISYGQRAALLRQVVRARYQPNVMARRGWQTIRRALAVAEQLPHDMSKLLRTARRSRLNVGLG